MSRSHVFALGVLASLVAAVPRPALAQTDRIIGRQGATQVSFQAIVAGSVVDRTTPITNSRGQFTGLETSKGFEGFYFGAWDIGYFTTEHFVMKFGNQFTGQITSGQVKPTVSGNVGGTYYFTPDQVASLYASGIYSFQMTNRSQGDRGSAVGSLGLQAAVRSNASIFFEGGYGRSLNEGGSGVLQSSVGLRILF
jgi:hypothetical protein